MKRWIVLFIVSLLSACTVSPETSPSPTQTPDPTPTARLTTKTPDPYVDARDRMVSTQIEARGVLDPMVTRAIRTVPRHRFVPEHLLNRAYGDSPLPIGHGQTISQPYIVALMSAVLELQPGDKVLEIGTGSGYQAAVLAEMGMVTYSVEIIPQLADEASARLHDLGYEQLFVSNADGYFGWEEFAPYDAIIVTAAPDHLPQPLVQQLKEGGRLVIPIGPQGSFQTLWLFEKVKGEVNATSYGAVLFVPLTRDLD